jgi:hypothetical protein
MLGTSSFGEGRLKNYTISEKIGILNLNLGKGAYGVVNKAIDNRTK